MVPDHEKFPYTLRVVSEITESNGSSSMATVCGTSLALMDAGVPLKAPTAGIAMGLILEGERYAVLSDILGDEDHLGDMDFKVAGTSNGVTSLQMDIKIAGITEEIMKVALGQAKDGRIHILGEMSKALDRARAELGEHAPVPRRGLCHGGADQACAQLEARAEGGRWLRRQADLVHVAVVVQAEFERAQGERRRAALEAFTRAREVDPKSAEARYQRAMAHAWLRQNADACASLLEACLLDTSSGRYLAALEKAGLRYID